MQMVAIELKPEQVEFWKFCNTQYTSLCFMQSTGVFEVRNGNAILSFDKNGTLRTIKRELFSYPVENFV